jgi:hypothetical protein
VFARANRSPVWQLSNAQPLPDCDGVNAPNFGSLCDGECPHECSVVSRSVAFVNNKARANRG